MAKRRISKFIAASILVLSSAMVLSSCDLNELLNQAYENHYPGEGEGGGGGGGQTKATIASVEITNKEALSAEWHVGDEDRTIDLRATMSDGTQGHVGDLLAEGKIVIRSSDAEVVNVMNKKLQAKKDGSATITVTAGNATDSVALTVLPKEDHTITLQALREGIANGTYKNNDTVEFEGIITATVEPTTGNDGHVYSGVYVQDGDYAIMLYAGKLSQYYEELQLKIGDSVHVVGVLSPYGGFNEVKPNTITKEITKELTQPTTLTVTGDDFADANNRLAGKDGNLAKMTNVLYKSGTITVDVAGKVHNNLVFSAKKSDQSLVDFDVAVSYHLGTDALTALKAVTDTLTPGDVCNLDGNLSINENKFQFALNFLSGKTPAQCVVKTGEHEDFAEPESITITSAGDVTEIEAGKKLQLTATITPSQAVQTVTWSSSDETIAKVGANTGLVEGLKEGDVVITATSTVKDSVTQTFNLKVKENNDPFTLVKAPEVGVAYKLGLMQENSSVNKMLYSNGRESGNYLATTDELIKGSDWYIENVPAVDPQEGGEGGETKVDYYLYTQVGEDKLYLNLVDRTYNNKLYHDPKLQAEAKTVWNFNTELNTFTTVDATDGEVYLGTYSTYTTLSISKISLAATSFVSHFYSIKPTLVKAAPQVDTPYLLGLNQENLNKMLFFTGNMDGYYYQTTASAQFGKNVYFESVTGGYNMYFKDGEGAKKYMNLVKSGNYNNVLIEDTAVTVWTYNSEYNTMTTELSDGTYYIGTYKTFNTISASKISNAPTSFVSHLYEALFTDDGEEEEQYEGFAALRETGIKVTDQPGVVTAVSGRNVYLDDGHAGILAYAKDNDAAAGINVGDFVAVSGSTSEYRSAIQIGDATFKAATGEKNELCAVEALSTAKAKEIFDAKKTYPGGRYSLRTGVIGGSGNFLTWTYGDIQMETGANVTAGMQAGKVYDLEGYVQGIYNNQYLLFVPTKATLVEVELTSLTCKASANTVKVGSEITLSAEGNPGADVTGVTFEITQGSDKASIDGNKLTGTAAGEVQVVAKKGAITSEPITITVEADEGGGGQHQDVVLDFSFADYATANNISSQTKLLSIDLDTVINASVTATDGNSGKIYVGSSYTEWRMYASGNATITISAKSGYTIKEVKAQVGTSNYGAPSEETWTITDGAASRTATSNFNVKSFKITYVQN